MYTKTVLTPDELAQILDGIWAYNRFGEVGRLTFVGTDGSSVPVERIEVWSGAPAIRVRSAPEEDAPALTPEEIAAANAGAALLSKGTP